MTADYDDYPHACAFQYEDDMPDPTPIVPWWKDGTQVRAMLSDLGKWLLVVLAAYWSHSAQVDSAVAKHGAEVNSERVGAVEKDLKAARPLVYTPEKK